MKDDNHDDDTIVNFEKRHRLGNFVGPKSRNRVRGNGEGSVVKRGNHYLCRVTIGKDKDGKPIRASATVKTRAEINATLARMQNITPVSLSIPVVPSNNRFTFSEYYIKFLQTYKKNVSQSCIDTYMRNKRRYIDPFPIAHAFIDEVTSADLYAILEKVQFETVAYVFVNHLKSVFSAAQSDGLIQRDPAAQLNYQPKYTNTIATKEEIDKKTIKALTEHEDKIFMQLAKENCYYPAIALCRYAGLRAGEACGLRWEEVDLDNRKLYIVASVTKNAEQGKETKYGRSRTKTKMANRSVLINDNLFGILSKLPCKTGYVSTCSERMINPRMLGNQIESISKTLKMVHSVHHLRHTYATTNYFAGVSPAVIQDWMGHSNIQTTMGYIHATETEKQKAIQSFNNMQNKE